MIQQNEAQKKATKNLSFDRDFVEFKQWLTLCLADEDRMNRRTPDPERSQGRTQMLEELLEVIDTAATSTS